NARSVARVLHAHPGQAWPPGGCRCCSKEADNARLAHADQGRGLSLGAPQSGRPQGPKHGATGRQVAAEGQPARPKLRLPCEGTPRSGDADRETGSEKLRTVHRVLAPAPANEKARGRLNSARLRLGTIPAALTADAPRFGTRSPAPLNNIREEIACRSYPCCEAWPGAPWGSSCRR